MIVMKIKGDKKVNQFRARLPRAMKMEIMKKAIEFTSFVQKSAKLRAPRQTGELAQSIMVKKNKENQIIITVDSPYGIYQEMGFEPHWVHALLPTKNRLGTIGTAMNVAGFVFVQKHTPFMAPALEKGLSILPNMLSTGTKKAINKARK